MQFNVVTPLEVKRFSAILSFFQALCLRIDRRNITKNVLSF